MSDGAWLCPQRDPAFSLRTAVFEQWAFVVVAALGVLLLWRARQASLASTAAAIGWALLVMVLVTMVFRWPLVAGHAADETVTSTLGGACALKYFSKTRRAAGAAAVEPCPPFSISAQTTSFASCDGPQPHHHD